VRLSVALTRLCKTIAEERVIHRGCAKVAQFSEWDRVAREFVAIKHVTSDVKGHNAIAEHADAILACRLPMQTS